MKRKKGQGGNIKTWIMENNTLDGANKTVKGLVLGRECFFMVFTSAVQNGCRASVKLKHGRTLRNQFLRLY